MGASDGPASIVLLRESGALIHARDGFPLLAGQSLPTLQRTVTLSGAAANCQTWEAFLALFAGPGGFAECHWCGDGDCEKAVQEETKVTIRNLPLVRDETPGSCVHCGKPSIGRVVFAQSY